MRPRDPALPGPPRPCPPAGAATTLLLRPLRVPQASTPRQLSRETLPRDWIVYWPPLTPGGGQPSSQPLPPPTPRGERGDGVCREGPSCAGLRSVLSLCTRGVGSQVEGEWESPLWGRRGASGASSAHTIIQISCHRLSLVPGGTGSRVPCVPAPEGPGARGQPWRKRAPGGRARSPGRPPSRACRAGAGVLPIAGKVALSLCQLPSTPSPQLLRPGLCPGLALECLAWPQRLPFGFHCRASVSCSNWMGRLQGALWEGSRIALPVQLGEQSQNGG